MCILAHATNKLFRKPEHRSRRTQVLGGAGSRRVGREEVLRGRQRPPSSAPGHRLSVCVVCVCLCVHVRVHTRARLASPLPREAPAFSQSSADPRVLGRLRVPSPEGFWVNSITSQVATVSPEESGSKSQLCLSLVQGYRNHGHTCLLGRAPGCTGRGPGAGTVWTRSVPTACLLPSFPYQLQGSCRVLHKGPDLVWGPPKAPPCRGTVWLTEPH